MSRVHNRAKALPKKRISLRLLCLYIMNLCANPKWARAETLHTQQNCKSMANKRNSTRVSIATRPFKRNEFRYACSVCVSWISVQIQGEHEQKHYTRNRIASPWQTNGVAREANTALRTHSTCPSIRNFNFNGETAMTSRKNGTRQQKDNRQRQEELAKRFQEEMPKTHWLRKKNAPGCPNLGLEKAKMTGL